MRRSAFHFDLPAGRIAQQPLPERGASRLLALDGQSGGRRDLSFSDLPALLRAGDLLVFNDTRVIPARLRGRKATGGRVEVLVERILGPHEALAHVRASKAPRAGTRLLLEGAARGAEQGSRLRDATAGGPQAPVAGGTQAENGDAEGTVEAQVLERCADLFVLRFGGPQTVVEILERVGHMPLPPYIDRPDTPVDRQRYQTVYARRPGAVAAPTAGLHFDERMLARLLEQGVTFAHVTLHVGAGTFQPVRAEDIRDHVMHSEWLEVGPAVCEAVARTRAAGGRVIAVGTTAVRCLETAARGAEQGSRLRDATAGGPQAPVAGTAHGPEAKVEGAARGAEQGSRLRDATAGGPQAPVAGAAPPLAPYAGETDLFIYPGYRFRVVDGLVTNFHLPESSLLMLVCAFGGYRLVMDAYAHAAATNYRFFSYGDAMFLTRNPEPDAP